MQCTVDSYTRDKFEGTKKNVLKYRYYWYVQAQKMYSDIANQTGTILRIARKTRSWSECLTDGFTT